MRNIQDISRGFEDYKGWGKALDYNERDRINKITEFIPKETESILDIGCGDGKVINALTGFSLIVGLDFCQTALNYTKTDKVVSYCDEISCKRGKFDLVLINEVLEHLEENVYTKTLKEILRLFPKFIIVSVPFNQKLKGFYTKCSDCGCVYLPDAQTNIHVRKFNFNDVTNLFKDFYCVDKIDYCGDTRSDPLLILKHKLGYYLYTKHARCPLCNSSNQYQKNDSLLRFINIINRVICRKEHAWLIVRYKLK